MARLYLNPDIFFLIRKQTLYVWNYQTDEQFSIDRKYLQRLIYWSGDRVQDSEMIKLDHELLENGLLSLNAHASDKWIWDERARIFYFGTNIRNHPLSTTNSEVWVQNYLSASQEWNAPQRFYPEGDKICLPSCEMSEFKNANLYDVLQKRRTSRNFFHYPISLAQLSNLLFITFGMNEDWNTKDKDSEVFQWLYRRTSPSGGSLHPTGAYVVICNIEGLQQGIYFYDAVNHNLIRISSLPVDFSFSSYLLGQFWAEELPFGIFCVCDFSLIWSKYPDARALRVGLMDIGHLSQTFLLSATALQLNTWLTAAFEDQKVHQLLKLPFSYHTPLLFLSAGHGLANPIPNAFANKEGLRY